MGPEPLRRHENVIPFRKASTDRPMILSAMIHRTLRHFDNRLFELATAAMMIAMALHVAVWPLAARASEFRYMADLMPPVAIVAIYGLGGALRFAALVANGHWPRRGPKLRAIGAVAGAVVWAQMCVSTVRFQSASGNPPTLDMWVYFTLSAVELIAMCRALVDDGRHR